MAASVAEGDGNASHTSLAAEVLQISNLLAQQASDKDGGSYKFSMNDLADGGSDESFELNRDDALQLIGVLNSRESDLARRELSSLISRMDRPAVEGMVRRLYGVLQRKNQELTQLENEAAKKSKGGRSTTLPGASAERTRRSAQHFPRGDHSLPGAVDQASAQAQKDAQPAPRSPRDSCGTGTFLSPRRAKEGGQLQQLKLMQEQRQAQYLRHLKERAGQKEEQSPRSPRTPREGPMPQVFRRLTAPATPPSDQMARIAVANMGANKAQVSFGGPLAESMDVSKYLENLLEAHRTEVTSHDDDIYGYVKPSPRVSKEKAQEIFDRLYKNGKDARIRRRVYAELGLLVEQAKEAQMCTFEPRLPLARYPDGFQPQESINERLYRDSFDRRRRREEAKQSMPLPTFRPNMSINSATSRRSEGGVSPRDTLDDEGFLEGGLTGDGSINRKHSPTHERLYREHADRKARQAHREDAMADWRKHTFKPDIRNSQATGPQIARAGNFFDQLERSRAEDTDGTYTLPGGRPLVPLRTNTHPAFEQELSDEEEMNMQQEDVTAELAESPNAREMSSVEVCSPFEASSYKLNPAGTTEVPAVEHVEVPLDITQVAVPDMVPDMGDAENDLGEATDEVTDSPAVQPEAVEEEIYEMPAADKLSAVCQELKVEAGELADNTGPEISHRTPDMYLHPQAQVVAGAAAQSTPRSMQPQRRQWVQTTQQPQLPAGAYGSGQVITRQESGYSVSGNNSPSMPYRHFSGRILTPRESSGNISVASLGSRGPLPMAYVSTGSSGPPMAVRTPSMHSQSAASLPGVAFAAWPSTGSGRLPAETPQEVAAAAVSPRVPISPRLASHGYAVSPGQVQRPMVVQAGQPTRYAPQPVMPQVPFQAQQQMQPVMMSPRGPWQVPATHR